VAVLKPREIFRRFGR